MNLYPCEKSYPDVAYLKTMYPQSVTALYERIADASDRLEYEGSFMFDEYPDHELVLKFIQDIIAEFPQPSPSPDCPSTYFHELVAVMVITEFIHRRLRTREF